MPSITNVGGSVTSALALTLLAWGFRLFRAAALRSDAAKKAHAKHASRKMSRFAAHLSPASLRLLVESDPFPHTIVDIRPTGAKDPLPDCLKESTAIPVRELEAALTPRKGNWQEAVGSEPPSPESTLVFVGDSQQDVKEAAVIAAACGYQKCLLFGGDFSDFDMDASLAPKKMLSRDATAALLGLVGPAGVCVDACVLDLRRHDERALYGCIPGTKHLPVDQIPAAMEMEDEAWKKVYGFPKPGVGDVVVMQCRTNRRAAWAAQVCADHGYKSCFVYKSGAYGWRLDPSVKAYASYEMGECPPEPEPFGLEVPDPAATAKELIELGLMRL
uniref:Rhodanese domain-containing protein n=1 Tax=Tetraselmis chuii TaxID=63592 RepID=A0A7S1X2T5_9CHLO|mmetsp:Transcript_23194/g.41208  ORF Transcript_23194/g.41208 Transcript_23194/m.41208 type:complete len:331 (+) Transcript_23194:202-1194(+)